MIKNYFIISLRNLFKHKINSVINLSGLALGIAVSIFIFLYTREELSFEKDFPDHELIYRLSSNYWAKSSPSEAIEIKNYFPQIRRQAGLPGGEAWWS